MTHATLAELAAALAAGHTTSRRLVEDCQARIAEPSGEGGRAFVSIDGEKALQAADAMDLLRRAGAAPSPFAGIPIAIKDLFDIEGEVTSAGSRALATQPPARRDAIAVARLRQAGFIALGRANMTEFAYSGLGMNPHYGSPRAPFEREIGRVSGGSTSGGAVAVADAMAHAALGTDTGGSCRIPAAFCGIVGFKPTARRVPQQGCVPLSPSLDSIGPLARSVQCCVTLDAILAGEDPVELTPAAAGGLRLAVPTTIALAGLAPEVEFAFERALAALAAAGAGIARIAVPEFDAIAGINAKGGFTAPESFAWHRALLAEKGEIYDPRVSSRIRRGESVLAADYLDAVAARRAMIARIEERLAGFDALVLPTVAILPPPIAALEEDEDAYSQANLMALRNCTLINIIDGCAISLPASRPAEAPVGLMIAGLAGQDRRILAIAAAAEALLR